MVRSSHSGVAKIERALPDIVPADWDNLRVFLRCAEKGSFRQAAQSLKLVPSTVLRRVAQLEEDLGARLFARLPDGVALTQEGRAVLDKARAVEAAVFEMMRAKRAIAAERLVVTVSITEGLGSYWVTRHLGQFRRERPDIVLRMNCAMESADVLRLQADMSVQLELPQSNELLRVRLGRLHIYPFASREYLRTYGTPKCVDDMRDHSLVNQVAPQLDASTWPRLLQMQRIEPITSFVTNASTAVLYAVEDGLGIGGLPTYVYARNKAIEPVDIGIHHEIDIWLTFHPATREDPRKALVIDWLKEIFSGRRHPWFRDQFIHPRDLATPPPFEEG